MGLCMRHKPLVHDDTRGWLWEALHREDLGRRGFGVLYVVVVRPGHFRGNHVHRRKSELFAAVAGRVVLELWRTNDAGVAEFENITLDGAQPEIIFVPPGVCHRITNLSQADAAILAYSDEPFDPNDPDTAPPPGGG